MPGSYYSDVERTIYLTYVILLEDIGKYDDLFQEERKYLSYEYYMTHIGHGYLEFDDLVYGVELLSDLTLKHPGMSFCFVSSNHFNSYWANRNQEWIDKVSV